MKMTKKTIIVLVILFSSIPFISSAQQKPAQKNNGETLIGRISYIEGQLLRYVPEEKDWVVAVPDAPFGIEDSLYTSENSRAEFIIPNNTWIRIDDKTQIQVLALLPDITHIDIASGVARFYNRSSAAVIKAATSFGFVVAPANTIFDLYVGNESVEVIALQGTVEFIHNAKNTKYEVSAGSFSIRADTTRVASINGTAIPAWNSWNDIRDEVWQKRLAYGKNSARYLPAGLRDNAYALEENGRWERVLYAGAYRNFWRPLYIYDGWSPYTVGRWTVWYGDHCWIPYEPFGYVTHHYGTWVYVNHCWYWAPPVTFVPVVRGPFIAFYWYPGRVSWIYTDTYIGWVPLAPWEPYYCYRYWGPASIIIYNVNIKHFHKGRHHHEKHAVMVRKDDFYHLDNYQDATVKNFKKISWTGKYRRIPVISDQVIKNSMHIKERYNFSNKPAGYRPHPSSVERITQNRAQAEQAKKGSGRELLKRIAHLPRDDAPSGGAVNIPEIARKHTPDRGIDTVRTQPGPKWHASQPEHRNSSAPVSQGTPVPRSAHPGGESQPIDNKPPRASGIANPRPPKVDVITIDQPEKPAKLKPDRSWPPQPPSSELPRPKEYIPADEIREPHPRPVTPWAERKLPNSLPESPTRLKEEKPFNHSSSGRSAEPDRQFRYERSQPASRNPFIVAPPHEIGIDRPERPVPLRPERAVPKSSPPPAELRETTPQQPVYPHQSPPSRQSGFGQQQRSQQHYAPLRGRHLQQR